MRGCLLAQIGLVVGAVAAVEAGGVGLDPVAERAAHEHVHRLPERPPLEIPQRDVDAAQRLDREPALAVIAQAVVEALPVPFDGERVLADQQRRVGLDDGAVRPRRAEGLAEAGQPLLADDLDDERQRLSYQACE